VPAIDGRTEDEMLVIVEDVPDDKEEEDAARSDRSSPSSLSMLSLLFFPARRLVGRSKF
jgi:hypothetical protein